MLRVRPTPFGRAAVDRLRIQIGEVKADDPLAPVVVLVPTNYAAVAVRRLLASEELGPISGHGTGLVGIDFLTPYRLAELFGAPHLAASGRRPLSNPVVAAAVRTVLAAEPGMFRDVVEHPSTERTLVRAHRELRDLDDTRLDTLGAQSLRAADVVRIHRATEAVLEPDWYDEFDLMHAATSIFHERPELLAERGHLVLYLPLDISLTGAAMLSTAAETVGLTVLAGVTGNPRADQPTLAVCERLGGSLPSVDLDPVAADHIISASDADDEVRSAVRSLVDAMVDGVPLHRMAVVHGNDTPYARLLEEQLDAAGITYNGEAVRTLASSLVGRTLLGLVALPDGGYRRADVLDLLAAVPIRQFAGQTRLTPVNAWERIARRAGVVGGTDEWQRRLGQLVDDHQSTIDDLRAVEPDAPRVRMLEREQRHASSLATFVAELQAALDPAAAPTTWSGLCTWAKGLLDRYVGPADERVDWPDIEVDAADKIEALLDALAGLDHVETATSPAVFRRTLELELDAGVGRHGAYGQGVFVGRIGQALGLDLDRIFVLGMAEGVFPSRRGDDSLLPDHERATLDGALDLRGADVDIDHRALLAAMAAAGHRTMFFPRGDLRRSNERVHSRWLLDSAERLAGERRQPEDLHADARDRAIPWIHEVPSFVAGLRQTVFPSTEQEFNLASLLRHLEAGRAAAEHELADRAPPFAAAVDLITSRRSSRFTRFDGDLRGLVTPDGVRTRVVSPTRLEGWAKCPHRYLFGDVLGVNVVERPDLELQITPIDMGSLVHDVLDRFIAEELAVRPEGYSTDQGPESIDRLVAIADEACDRLAARGLVGKEIFWRRDRARIVADLVQFLQRDDEQHPRHRVEQSELGFGVPDARRPPVQIALPDGRTVRFRGAIDRVDRRPSGQLVVIDYKTGSTREFKNLSSDDPVIGGTKLQLPIYAAAAAAAYDASDHPVHAAYWFITSKADWKWIGYDVTDEVLAEFTDVVGTIVAGIEEGLFPARPPATPNPIFVECRFCDPDGLGTAEARAQWDRKRHDPALRSYVEMVEPEALTR